MPLDGGWSRPRFSPALSISQLQWAQCSVGNCAPRNRRSRPAPSYSTAPSACSATAGRLTGVSDGRSSSGDSSSPLLPLMSCTATDKPSLGHGICSHLRMWIYPTGICDPDNDAQWEVNLIAAVQLLCLAGLQMYSLRELRQKRLKAQRNNDRMDDNAQNDFMYNRQNQKLLIPMTLVRNAGTGREKDGQRNGQESEHPARDRGALEAASVGMELMHVAVCTCACASAVVAAACRA